MRQRVRVTASLAVALIGISAVSPFASAATPAPWDGTVFITPSFITPASPTDFTGLTSTGTGSRRTYDRRSGWVTQDALLFRATFTGSAPVEVIVDPALASTAPALAEHYARVVGQLPRSCRTQVDALWLHPGNEALGGGNRSLLIHTDYESANAGYLEEALLHECAHTSLDYAWSSTTTKAAWDAARTGDPGFISTYAEQNPDSEDVAESFGPYLAWKWGAASGLSDQQRATIAATIPQRLAYFDRLNLDLAPVVTTANTMTPSSTATLSPPRVRSLGSGRVTLTITPIAGTPSYVIRDEKDRVVCRIRSTSTSTAPLSCTTRMTSGRHRFQVQAFPTRADLGDSTLSAATLIR